MKNIALQSMQATTLKNTVDVGSKNDAGTSSLDSDVTKNSFQMTLNNQVQANQNKSAQDVEQPAARGGSTKPDSGKQGAADQLAAKLQSQVKARNGGHVANDAKAVLDNKSIDLGLQSGEALIPPKLLGADSERDAKVDTSSGSLDTNVAALDASVIVPIVLVNGNVPAPVTSQENGAQVNQGLDAVLSKALTSAKSFNELGNDVPLNTNVEKSLGSDAASEHARWIDAMLPAAAKSGALDESVVSKLDFNATKDSAAKEFLLKEVPATANFQAATQFNPSLSGIQIGSTNTISSYPGKSGWDQAISQKVVWMVGVGEQSATLTLNPPDLGPLQVVIHVHNDQADTTFISDNLEVRQALENGLSNLRDKMSDAGIQLGQANVSAGSQSQQEFQRATQGRLTSDSNGSSEIASQLIGVGGTEALVRTTNGLVDTFA